MARSKRTATTSTDGNTALQLLQDDLPGATVRVGGLPAGATLLQDFRLPVLPFGPTSTVMDAFHQATEERKMVAVIGDRGVGKSMAVDRALEAFEELEVLRNQADSSLPVRRVFRVRSPRASRRLDVLDCINYAAIGSHLETRERSRSIPEDILLETVTHELLHTECAALVFDEAENLSLAALDVLRDIVSFAESASSQRYSTAPGSERRQYAAAGIGILLVGAPELRHRFAGWDETGRRLVAIRDVRPLSSKEAARAYRAFLPCIEAAAAQMGDDAWLEYVRSRFAPGRIPFAHVENHVRHYLRRVLNSDASIATIEQVPFLEPVFAAMWNERAVPPQRMGA